MKLNRLLPLALLIGCFFYSQPVQAEDDYWTCSQPSGTADCCGNDPAHAEIPYYRVNYEYTELCNVSQGTLDGYCRGTCQACGQGALAWAVSCTPPEGFSEGIIECNCNEPT